MEKPIKKILIWNTTFFVNPNDQTLSFEGKSGKVQISEKLLREASKAYKGTNVVHKPFFVLVAQQFILKNSNHKIDVAELIPAEKFKADFVPDIIEE